MLKIPKSPNSIYARLHLIRTLLADGVNLSEAQKRELKEGIREGKIGRVPTDRDRETTQRIQGERDR